jgi:DnaK suppressor protein
MAEKRTGPKKYRVPKIDLNSYFQGAVLFYNFDTYKRANTMTQEERDTIRKHIEKEILTLKKSINTLTELAESDVQSDANDWFSSKESNASGEINDMALSKARQRLMVLNEVLQRIDKPEFGICVKCNKQIAVGRLMANPTATRCISC